MMTWEMVFKVCILIMFLTINIIMIIRAITLLYYEKHNYEHFQNLMEELLKEGDWTIK